MTDDAPTTVGGHHVNDLARIAREEIPGDATPGFAAVSGSHSYGWADETSDVDLRGFHVADGHRYALLDRPDEQVAATFTSRRGDEQDVDFVSYELRKFGVLVADRNFNALETLFAAPVVHDTVPDARASLRAVVEDRLPMDVPARYAGMAESNRDAIEAGGRVKRALYAIRGLLAARYVTDEAEIVADIRVLSRSVLGDTALVDDLIAAKQTSADAVLDPALAQRAEAVYDSLAEEPVPDSADRSGYRKAVDGWMRDIRGWSGRTSSTQ